MERFACGVTVISGEDALEAMEDGAGKKLLLVTDLRGRQSAGFQWILERARPGSAAFFDEVSPEPTVGQAVAGSRFLRETAPDLVVGLGGGNVLNCAKAMAGFSGISTPLTLIPTDIGSGAETGDTAMLFHDRRLHLLQGTAMGPERVILDGRFLQEKPGREIAEGGFGLLAVSLEGYCAPQAGVLAGMYAREAFSTGWAVLPAAFSGQLWARRRAQMASVMASVAADQAGGGLCAALCGNLESVFHIPAGRLAAVLLPVVMEVHSLSCGRRYAELARSAGLGGSSEPNAVRNLRTGLIRLRKELGLPESLLQAGVPPGRLWGNIPKLVEMTLEDRRCRSDPVRVDDYMIRRILDTAAG